MDYPALRKLIDSDPANATKTDAEVLAWLKDKSAVTRRRTVSPQEVVDYLRTQGKLAAVMSAAGDVNHAAHGPAKMALDGLQFAGVTGLDGVHPQDDPWSTVVLPGLVSGGVLTQAEADAITAMGTETVSRAEDAGLGDVRLGDVIEARSGRYN